MASFTYNAAKVSLGKAEIDWVNDTIKVALLTSAHTPDQDADVYFSDVVAEEFSGGSYTAGGITLASKTATQDNTNNRAVFDAADGQFTGITGTFRYAVVYKSTGSNATSRLIRLIDLSGGNTTLTNGTYDLVWPASGVFNLTD